MHRQKQELFTDPSKEEQKLQTSQRPKKVQDDMWTLLCYYLVTFDMRYYLVIINF